MTAPTRALCALRNDVGDLVAAREGRGEDYTDYAADPVGFIRDVLRGDPWARQVEVARAVRDDPQVAVRSCHAAGKDWLAGRLALWWAYAVGGLAVVTGPTAAQVEEILMRGEVRNAFLAGGLPGDLHVRALRPGGGGGEAGILARTASDVHALTGLHRARVLYILTEAQDPDLGHAFDAAFAVCTGAEDRILAVGNPTEPGTRFEAAHRPGSGWRTFKIAADDIPNVREGRTVVPGLLTVEGVERIAREYGKRSPFYTSRVLAEFPATAEDSLLRPEWINRAEELGRTGALEGEAARESLVFGVDPARLGPDSTAVCVRQGPAVRGFTTWDNLDTMRTADMVLGLVRRAKRPVELVVVDGVGLGGGVVDRLRETLSTHRHRGRRGNGTRFEARPPEVAEFTASERASEPGRFTNARAEAAWNVRRLLEDGRLGLPEDARLRAELLAQRVRFGADGRVSLDAKENVRSRLGGRSGDRFDALALASWPLAEPTWRVEGFHWM